MILTCEFCKEGERFQAKDPMQLVFHLEGHVKAVNRILETGFKKVEELEEEVANLYKEINKDSKEKREKKK